MRSTKAAAARMAATTTITMTMVVTFALEFVCGVFVGVGAGVLVGLGVAVGVAVGACVGIAVGWVVGVLVGAVVGVGVAVGVGEGVGEGEGEGVGVTEASYQFQTIVDGAVIANVVTDEVPEADTLPVPVQPEQVIPEAGDETYAVMLVLLSYHLLVGEGESYGEVTVK